MRDPSFDEFAATQLPALDRYAYALTGNRHDAEDLVQETLIKLVGAWRRIEPDGNPAGYARTIMFRTHVSAWRRRSRRPDRLALEVDPAAGTDDYATVDARMALAQALSRLPRLQRAVLVASYLDDCPDEEIAELIGRSPVTVRSLRYRGLRAIQKALVSAQSTNREGDNRDGSEFSVA